MLAIVLIVIFAIYMTVFFPYDPKKKPTNVHSQKFNMQMDKLWSVARTSMKASKNTQAERALLSILKFDETNAAAYNRLGILYAKSQKFDEAIECFEIAQSLDDNPSSLHNVGLIYLETGSFEKAVIAFEQAIAVEGDIPIRYIALAKAYEKLGKRKDALESLENAYELDHSVTTLRQMLALHEEAGDQEAMAATAARIEKQLAENAAKRAEKAAAKQAPTARPRRRILRRSAAQRTAKATKKASATAKKTSTTAKKASAAKTRTAGSTKTSTRAVKPSTTAARPATTRRVIKRTAVSRRPARPAAVRPNTTTKTPVKKPKGPRRKIIS